MKKKIDKNLSCVGACVFALWKGMDKDVISC